MLDGSPDRLDVNGQLRSPRIGPSVEGQHAHSGFVFFAAVLLGVSNRDFSRKWLLECVPNDGE